MAMPSSRLNKLPTSMLLLKVPPTNGQVTLLPENGPLLRLPLEMLPLPLVARNPIVKAAPAEKGSPKRRTIL